MYLLLTIATYVFVIKGIDAVSSSAENEKNAYGAKKDRITTAPATNETVKKNRQENADDLKEQIKKDISLRYGL